MSTIPQPGFDPDRLVMPQGPAFIEAGIRGRPLSEASHKLMVTLRRRLRGRVVIMGIGNPMLGDDGVGCAIVQQLRKALAQLPGSEGVAGITLVDAEEVPESHTGVVEAARPELVLLIDAADFAAAPGSVGLIEGGRLEAQAAFTHRTPLAPLARYLMERTHANVLLIGIQPGRMEWGDPLTPDVAATADQLLAILLHALHPAHAPEQARPAEAVPPEPAPVGAAAAAAPDPAVPEAPVC